MSQTIRLIVGLANPGSQYISTRHNAGAWFIDHLLSHHHIELKLEKKFKGYAAHVRGNDYEYHALIPMTYMNLSGEAVGSMAKFYKIEPQEILIAHDELDLPPGIARLKKGGGHGGHNGLRSVISHLGSNDFMRLRIGIGHPGRSDLVTDYVLSKPSKSDKEKIDSSIYHAEQVIDNVIMDDLQKAMTALHTD